MVVLTLQCTTVDSTSSTLYALTLATTLDKEQQYYVLIKSNSNPTSWNAIVWSYVSIVSNKTFRPIRDATLPDVENGASGEKHPFACAVEPLTEVFTAVAFNANAPLGVQYNPNLGGSEEKWIPYLGNAVYKWPRLYHNHVLFYSTHPTRGSVLVHAVAEADRTKNVWFGVLDPLSKNFVSLFGWTLPEFTNNTADWTIAHGANRLYVHLASSNSPMLYVFDLPSMASITPTIPMNYSASGTLGCSKQPHGSVPGVIGSTYYVACTQSASTTAENQLFTLNTINAATPALNPIVSIQGSLADAMTLLPIAASPTTSKPQFAFIQSTKGQGYGVMMDKPGSTIPAPLIGPISPNVTHPKLAFIENGQPFVEDEVDGDEGGSGGKAKTGLIVGIIAAVMVLGVLGFVFWRRRRVATQAHREKQQEQQQRQEAESLGTEKQPTTSEGSQQQQHAQGTFKIEAEQNHIVDPIESTPVLGGGYYSSFQPQQHQELHHEQQQQHPSYDHFLSQPPLRMQGFQFSSHPRPSYVSTSSAAGNENVVAGADEPFNPIWEPKPFSPPRPHPSRSPSSQASRSNETTNVTNSETRVPQAPQDTSQGEGYGYGPGYEYEARLAPEVRAPHVVSIPRGRASQAAGSSPQQRDEQ